MKNYNSKIKIRSFLFIEFKTAILHFVLPGIECARHEVRLRVEGNFSFSILNYLISTNQVT